MFNVPEQNLLLQKYSYTDVFMLTLLFNVGIFGVFIFCAFLICLIVKQYQMRQAKKIQLSRDSQLTYQTGGRDSVNTLIRAEDEQKQRQNEREFELPDDYRVKRSQTWKISLFDVVNLITSFLFYLLLADISLMYLSIYIFGFFGKGTSHDVLAVSISTAIVLIPAILWKVNTAVKNQKKTKKEIIFTAGMLLLWTAVCVLAVIMLKGVCVCVFNDNYGFQVMKDFQYSTQFIRSIQIPPVCANDQLCHLYATLGVNTSTSVFINAHTGLNVMNLTVILAQGSSKKQITSRKPIQLRNMETIAQRNVFSFHFQDLTPNSKYTVTIISTDSQKVLKQTHYQTLPGSDAQTIRMVVGGDVGLNQEAKQLTSYLDSYDPHVIILGGDIAYDDGMTQCFYSWDNLYQIFQEFNDRMDKLVPLIMSVGNHDVGFDALANVKLDFTQNESVPLFFVYNPQHLTSSSRIPEHQDRRTYHHHVIGPMVHLHLDSGYIQSFKDQVAYIKLISKDFGSYYKFANYHNPLYPSCVDSSENSVTIPTMQNDVNVIRNGKEHWTPEFDANNFVAAFEHHTHHRKFTKKIKGDKPVGQEEQGVRYIGDGSWGVPEGECSSERITKSPQYFQYYDRKQPNHIWKITLQKTTDSTHTIKYQAIGIDGESVYNTTDNLSI